MRHLINLFAISFFFLTTIAADNILEWSPEVMMKTKTISDIQLSPNHESILFVAKDSKMTDEQGVSLSRIYLSSVSKKTAIPFSALGVSSTLPRWSPDGQWIAFLSNREGKTNLYLIRSDGGEAIPLTKTKRDIPAFSWSPDGNKIAFIMADETENEKNREKTSLAYRYRDEALVNRLWLIDVFSSEPTPIPLTSDEYSLRCCGDFGVVDVEFDWSPDSKEIVFAHSPAINADHFHLNSSLATVNILSGETCSWKNETVFEAYPQYSPDGQWVAYLSGDSSKKYANIRQIGIRSRTGEYQRLLADTFNHGSSSGSSLIGWSDDGDHLLVFEPKGTKYHLSLLSLDGLSATEVDTGDLFFKEPTLSADRKMLSFVSQTPSNPPEVFISKLKNFEPVQVSSINQSLLFYPKTETTIVSWNSKDKMPIEGLLTYPINYEEGKQYPLLVVVHGGPMGFFDQTFLGTPNPYPLASFSQAGFFVFRPNPRGSSGYGKDFRCANYNDWGGMDFTDIMSGIDALIEKDFIDPERLGIMGWSYGGYMTAWAVAQTSRFKAASIGAGLSNLVSMNGTTDLHSLLTDYLGDSHKNSNLYMDRSPINYVENISTPCLIQHGTADKRVPVSQAYEFYHALERSGKKAELVLYPGMKHRINDPKMQRDAMERNLAWFQLYLNKFD